MIAKRIIPCLDVKDDQVVKGIKFRDHQIVGDILERAAFYSQQGADELVFYDITASSDGRRVDRRWITRVAKTINIPFCVAGGIRTLRDAASILEAGADKISINSPALENPELITQLVKTFGQQCIVIGIDSLWSNDNYYVYQYTGDVSKTKSTGLLTEHWVAQVQDRGAGEIVLNCMNQDGVRSGYDLDQLKKIHRLCNVPLIASGGAGTMEHFFEVFIETNVDGALAASVFHKNEIRINALKEYLSLKDIRVRL